MSQEGGGLGQREAAQGDDHAAPAWRGDPVERRLQVGEGGAPVPLDALVGPLGNLPALGGKELDAAAQIGGRFVTANRERQGKQQAAPGATAK